ncbi:MAG: hypothetical protein M3010_01355 [Candidatus Dormibacteraeota bacterium]|nr:hypothetical protein [Candidatus Dormibacteraeota bacterium]
MAPDERRWLLRAGLLLLTLTIIPLVVAALAAPPGQQFSGFVYEARDGASYVGKATEGLAGHWLYHDPYTSEAQPPTLIYAPYLLLGQLDRPLGAPLALVLQLARVLLALALVVAVYRVAAADFPDRPRRRLTFLLVVLGGGVGALSGGHLDILGYHYVSLDVAVSGTVGMQTLNLAPHILLACLGMAVLALLWVRQEETPSGGTALAAGGWCLVVSSAYPQVALLAAVVTLLSAILVRRRGAFGLAAAVTLAAIPYAVYGLYLRQSNPVFRAWPPQSDIDVGDPLSLLLFGHLVMLPFVLVAIMRLWRRRRDLDRRLGMRGFCAIWLLSVVVLMYLPGLPTVMHRVFYGSFIPFGVLAADGLWAWSRERRRPSRRLLVYPAMLMCLAGFQAVAEGVAIPLLHRDDRALYFPSDEARVLAAAADARPGGGGLVLNSYLSGLVVPGISRQDTYIGFPFETLDLARKNAEVRRIYTSRDSAEVARLVRATRADYLLWGRYEAGFRGQDPGALEGWPVVASRGNARLYAVPHP